MSVYCLTNGVIFEASEESFLNVTPSVIYHLAADGTLKQEENMPELSQGEGLFVSGEGFYVEPLEVQVEFAKSYDAKEWLEALALRHAERLRQIDQNLWVITEIKEGDV